MERPNQKDYDFNDAIEGVRFAKDMINYADYMEKQLRLYGVVKPFVCNNCQSKEEKKLTTSTSECLKCGTLQSN